MYDQSIISIILVHRSEENIHTLDKIRNTWIINFPEKSIYMYVSVVDDMHV